MSKGMIKTTIREIRGSLGRYMAILAIVMLGVGFFSGLKATTPAMIATENDYLAQQNFFDFRLLSTVGFDEEDVEELTKLDEIADVEGAVSVDALCILGEGNESVYKIHTLPESINRVVLTAGRMPERADECLLDSALYGEDAVGMQITVTDNNDEDTLKMFENRTFTAVGIVRSPYYINFERGTSSIGEGKITAFLYVPREAFACDYLTEIYMTARQKFDVYTDEYEDYIDAIQDEIEEKNELLATERYEELITEAQEKIDDAQTELDDKKAEAEKELADAWQEILDGEQEIKDGEQEIKDGEQEIADGKKEIADHEQEIKDGEQEITDGEQEIQDKETELQDAEKEVSYHEWEVFDSELNLASAWDQLEQAKEELKEQEDTLLGKDAELTEKETELAGQKTALEEQKTALEGQEAAKEQIQSGLSQLQSGLEQIQAGKSELEEGKEQIKEAKNKLAFQEQVLLESEAELQGAKDEVTNARTELEDGKAELEKAKQELEDAKTELADGKVELEKAKTDLVTAEAELKDGKADLEEGKTELADAKMEYADAQEEFEQEVEDAQEKIDDARAELADIEEPDSYVLNRNTNIGYACYESDSNIVAAIANVFPVFFFLVAALICMTTMNRMVEEQRTQIGVLKALGYGNASIMGKYLFYAGSAAAIGAVIGCAFGTWLFPRVIWTGYGIMYSMGEIEYFFDFWVAALSFAAALLCSVGAAYFSCRHELQSVPANLIRPKAPRSGKRILLERITVIWSRLKFLHKVSLRNIVRYKKRFFMMVLGISGCTALLVTGFGIRDSVTNIADMQYDEVQIYDIGITFKDGVQTEDMEKLMQTVEATEQIACRYEESVDIDFAGKIKSVYLEIPEDAEKIGTFLNLHTKEGEAIPYPGDGEAVLTAKIAENMGIEPGDQVTLRDNDMNSFTVSVAALCENYVYNYIYVNKETYVNQFGKEPEYKSAYVLIDDGTDVHEAAAVFSDLNHVLSVSVVGDMRQRIGTMMESMDYIVALIIVCAGSLAFIVLYNLTNINITERIREIATIKVLGFYAKETADYVFRENLALTAIGAVVGLLLGKWLHWFVMYNINIDMVSFKTLITPSSYLLSLLFTFGFALLVNGLMYFKLEKINMAESLKSIE